MGLTIRTTDIQLGIETTPGQWDIRTQSAKLEMHQKHAKVNIRTEKPRVLIDQYECFAEEGLKNNYDFTKEAAQRGYQQAMEFIGKTAQDGYTLAAIENGGNPIAAIAKRDSSPQKEFVLAIIPRSRPKIDVTGNVDIQWDRNWEGVMTGIEGRYIPGFVDANYNPGKVNIYVKQYPSVDIKYDGNIDVSI
jgi:hypothetical protein